MSGSKIFKHEIVYNVPLIIYWSNTKILNQIYITCMLYLCTLYIYCSILAGPLGIIQLCCHLWRRCPQARTESCSVPLWQPPPNADYWVWHLVLAIGFINTCGESNPRLLHACKEWCQLYHGDLLGGYIQCKLLNMQHVYVAMGGCW